LEDNPYVDEEYKERIKNSLSGMFYKRNYLGLWCMAEGAVFDFFDKDIHVVSKPPRAAEYWIAGIDFGMNHACTCILIGVSTGRYEASGKCLWVEKEYVWDVKEKSRQKLVGELADDIQEFLSPYSVKAIYIDPSAEVLQAEFRRKQMHVVHANNDVLNGIAYMTSEMANGNLFVLNTCKHLIKEIEGYVWDSKKAARGEDAPLKQSDDCTDALRYAIFTHKVSEYKPNVHDTEKYQKNRFQPTRRSF
jgi:PBSX family phage terminase large subunit